MFKRIFSTITGPSAASRGGAAGPDSLAGGERFASTASDLLSTALDDPDEGLTPPPAARQSRDDAPLASRGSGLGARRAPPAESTPPATLMGVAPSPSASAGFDPGTDHAVDLMQDLLRSLDRLSPEYLRALSNVPAPSVSLQLLFKALMVALSEKPVLVRNVETGERAASFWAAAHEAMADVEAFFERVRGLARADLAGTVVRHIGTILADPECSARDVADSDADAAPLARFLLALHRHHSGLAAHALPSPTSGPFDRSAITAGSHATRTSLSSAALDPSPPRPLGSSSPPGVDSAVLDDLPHGPAREEVRAGMQALQSMKRQEFNALRTLTRPPAAVARLLEALVIVMEGPPTDAAASPKGEAYPREVRKCLKSPSHTTSRLHEAFSVPLPGPSRRALEPYMREGVLDAEAIAAAGGAACSKLLAVIRGIWRLHDVTPATPSAATGTPSPARIPAHPVPDADMEALSPLADVLSPDSLGPTHAAAGADAKAGGGRPRTAWGRTPSPTRGPSAGRRKPAELSGASEGVARTVSPSRGPPSPGQDTSGSDPAEAALLAAIREFRSVRRPPSQAQLVAESVCVALGLPPVRAKDVTTGKVRQEYWPTAVQLCQEPYRLRKRLSALLHEPMDAPRYRRFVATVSQLDPSDVSATASQPAAVIAAHLARVQEVQATMDHPSSPSPEPGDPGAFPAMRQVSLTRQALDEAVLDAVESPGAKSRVRAGLAALASLTRDDFNRVRTLARPPAGVRMVMDGVMAAAGHYGEKGVSWTATKLALRDASGLVAALGEALTSPLSAAKLRVLITHMKEEMLTSGGAVRTAGPEIQKLHAVLIGIWSLNQATQPALIEKLKRASDTPARARPAAESAPAAPAPEADDTGMIDIALLGISKPEISMLRALRTPSPAVIPVFEAVSLLLGQSPVMVPVRNATPKGKTHAPDWWKTALSMMHDVNRFLNRLQDVADRCILHNDADKLSIAPEALHRVGVLLERGALEPESLRTVSLAAAGIAVWAKRVYDAASAAGPSAPTLGGLTAISEARVHNPSHLRGEASSGPTPGYMRPTKSSSFKATPADDNDSPGPGSVSQISRMSSIDSRGDGTIPRYMLPTASFRTRTLDDSDSDAGSAVGRRGRGPLRSRQGSLARDAASSPGRNSVENGSRHFMLSTQSSRRRMSQARTLSSDGDVQSVVSVESRQSGVTSMRSSRYRSPAIVGDLRPHFMRTTSSKALKMVTPHVDGRSISKKVHHIEFVSRNDVVELRGLRSPDKAVRLVMSAVAILLGIEPVRTHDFYNRRMEEDYWAPCVRAMLSVDDFLEQMRQCRQLRPTLHPTKWRKLRDIAQSPFFDPDIVGACSRAAVGMTRWVLDVWERGVAKMEGPRDADDGSVDSSPRDRPHRTATNATQATTLSSAASAAAAAVRKTVFRLADLLTPRHLARARDAAATVAQAGPTSADNTGAAHSSGVAHNAGPSPGGASHEFEGAAVAAGTRSAGEGAGAGLSPSGGGGAESAGGTLRAHALSPGVSPSVGHGDGRVGAVSAGTSPDRGEASFRMGG